MKEIVPVLIVILVIASMVWFIQQARKDQAKSPRKRKSKKERRRERRRISRRTRR